MANDHVEIHDPISNHRNVKNSTDCDPQTTCDTPDMEDTVEYRILMAYAQRRRPPKKTEKTSDNGTAPSQTPAKTELKDTNDDDKKKKKKKGWKRLLKILKCVQPQTEEKEPQQTIEKQQDEDNRCNDVTEDLDLDNDDVEEKDTLVGLASRLTRIADEIPFIPPDIESDGPEDVTVERAIGLILRESGDALNEQELKKLQQAFWDYSLFRSIITSLLTRMGLRSPNPDSPGPHASPKTHIAVACETVSRLSAMDTQPMNKLLGFGARYLNEFHSGWVKEQGGYEKAFESDDEDEVQ